MSNVGPTSPNSALGPATQAGQAPSSYTSTLLIEELTAAQGKQPRTVTLQGPGLPFMGAAWSGGNRLSTTWYPGNGDEASQQNLGPKELPSHWQGEWNRTLMGKAPSSGTGDDGLPLTFVDPNQLADFLEQVLRGGLRLRVTWSVAEANGSSSNSAVGAGPNKKVREGRAKTWNFKYTRMQDIAWDIEFEWQSRGARVQTVASTRDGGLTAAAAALNNMLSNLASVAGAASFVQSNASILGSATSLTLGQLEVIADTPSLYMSQIQRTVEQLQYQLGQVVAVAQTLQSQPAQVVQAAIATGQNAIANIDQFVQSMNSTPCEELTTSGSSVADMVRTYQYQGQLQDAALQIGIAAQQLVAVLQQKAPLPPGAGKLPPPATPAAAGNADVLTAYTVKDGDTVHTISQRFYGTPDHAQDILQANRMPWHQVTFNKGKILLIPKLRTQQRTS